MEHGFSDFQLIRRTKATTAPSYHRDDGSTQRYRGVFKDHINLLRHLAPRSFLGSFAFLLGGSASY
jgi:hypothetical protein